MAEDVRRKNASLTGIRGAAALWVFLFHFVLVSERTLNPIALPGLDILLGGYLGVDLFFMLSGFILMTGHARDFDRLDLPTCIGFYRARFWRVYPPSVAALLVIAMLLYVDQGLRQFVLARSPNSLSLGTFLNTAALATRWGFSGSGSWNEPIWSLSVEIGAYGAFPVLAWLALRVRSRHLLLLLGIGPLIGLIAIQHFEGSLSANFVDNPGPWFRVGCCFTCGVFLYLLTSVDTGLARFANVIGIVSLLATTTVLLVSPTHRNLVVLCLAGMLISCAGRRGWLYRGLASRPMVFLGRISFPFYLLHLTILTATGVFSLRLGLHGPAYLVISGIAFAGLIALSTSAHHYVEVPAHRLARRERRNVPHIGPEAEAKQALW